MGKKTISIPDDVYERLCEERRPDERFGETIDRLLDRSQLSDVWGAWNEETAEAAREAISTSRERSRDRLEAFRGIAEGDENSTSERRDTQERDPDRDG